MAESWNKKERENKKRQQHKDKEERKKERKEQSKNGDDMIAYLDENGNLTSTPPDPSRRKEFKLEDIQIGVPPPAEVDPAEAFRSGVLTNFNTSKGFGFVKDSKTQESYFVHVSNFQGQISEGDKVSFELGMGQRGMQAINVKPL
jgi:cold shock CspA family protein